MTTDLPDPHACPHCGHNGLATRWGETICGMCNAPRATATPGCPVRNVLAGDGGLFSIREAAEDERRSIAEAAMMSFVNEEFPGLVQSVAEEAARKELTK